MILAVNAGNTTIRAALGQKNGPPHSQIVFCAKNLDEAVLVRQIEERLGADIWGRIQGSILASVVPEYREIIKAVITHKTGRPVQRVDTLNCGSLKTGQYEGLLGEDRAVCCAQALKKFAPPLVVIDCGTATTVNVVNESGEFLGGAIMAGLQTGLDSLARKTAQLPAIKGGSGEISAIGKNTEECLLSGAVIGLAAAIEGYVERIAEHLNAVPKIILTGGHAELVLPHCRFDYIHEPLLLLEGLFDLYTLYNL